MTLNGEAASAILRHALMGTDPHALVGGALPILNRAGRYLAGIRDWSSRRRIGKANKVAAQSYFTLPSNYEGDQAATTLSSLTGCLRFVDDAELLAARSGSVQVASESNFIAAIFPQNNPDPRGGAPVWVAELHPTPQESVTDFFTFSYWASWTELGDITFNFDIPASLEELYLQIVRAFGQSYQAVDGAMNGATLDQRLAALGLPPVFVSAAAQDRVQSTFGELTGGFSDGGYLVQDFDGEMADVVP